MKIIKTILGLALIILLLAGCSQDATKNSNDNNNQPTVAVSIIPQETFVREVAGDKVDIVVMVPPGSNPENYQPSPRQMTSLSNADIYFSLGVPTDTITILPSINEYSDAKIVHLDREVAKVHPDRIFTEEEEHHHHDHDHDHTHSGRDPHIWLSPKRAIVMVETIQKELSSIDPANKTFYEQNAEKYVAELRDLDDYINNKLEESNKKTFLIYHPAYGYFADDYGLRMVSIEEDGKEATAKKIQGLIDTAKKEDIQIILYQEEFSDEQAKTIAKEIDGAAVKVSPLGADYIENLRQAADYIVSLEVQ